MTFKSPSRGNREQLHRLHKPLLHVLPYDDLPPVVISYREDCPEVPVILMVCWGHQFEISNRDPRLDPIVKEFVSTNQREASTENFSQSSILVLTKGSQSLFS